MDYLLSQSVLNALNLEILIPYYGIFKVWLPDIFILVAKNYLIDYGSIMYGNLFSNCVAAIIFIYIIAKKIKWESGGCSIKCSFSNILKRRNSQKNQNLNWRYYLNSIGISFLSKDAFKMIILN